MYEECSYQKIEDKCLKFQFNESTVTFVGFFQLKPVVKQVLAVLTFDYENELFHNFVCEKTTHSIQKLCWLHTVKVIR